MSPQSHEPFRKRLLARAGIMPPATSLPDVKRLAETEWCTDFERLMRARMVMGALRYGRLGAVGKPVLNRAKLAKGRLDAYARTGNLELLADAANLCLIEFVESVHPRRHFRALDRAD